MNNQERNAKIIGLRSEGIGPRDIARRLEIGPSIVAGVLFRSQMTCPTASVGGRGNGATKEFKRLAIEALKYDTWKNVASAYGVHQSTIGMWRKELSA